MPRRRRLKNSLNKLIELSKLDMPWDVKLAQHGLDRSLTVVGHALDDPIARKILFTAPGVGVKGLKILARIGLEAGRLYNVGLVDMDWINGLRHLVYGVWRDYLDGVYSLHGFYMVLEKILKYLVEGEPWILDNPLTWRDRYGIVL